VVRGAPDAAADRAAVEELAGQSVRAVRGIEERAAREFRIFAGEFGWTPAAEARLGRLPEEDTDNPFAC
jgi:phage terminase small subunit